jgi:hypothetical protein
VIAEQLGVDPGPELRQFHARIRPASPSSRASTPATFRHAIPASAPPLSRDHTHITRFSQSPPSRPRPQEAAGRQDFARELTLGRDQAGLTTRQTAAAAGITAPQAEEYFTAKHCPR